MVPSSLDSSTRDVPPSTLDCGKPVGTRPHGDICVTDRQDSSVPIPGDDMAPAAERTGPLPAGPWAAVFDDAGGYDCQTSAWDIRDKWGKTIATVDLRDFGQERWWGHGCLTSSELAALYPEAEAVARLMARAWELR